MDPTRRSSSVLTSRLPVVGLAIILALSPAISGLPLGQLLSPADSPNQVSATALDGLNETTERDSAESLTTELPEPQRANLDLSDRLAAVTEDPATTDSQKALRAAELAINERGASRIPTDPETMTAKAAELANIDLSRATMAVEDDPHLTDEEKALRIAELGLQDRMNRFDDAQATLSQQQTNLETSRDLLAGFDDGSTTDLERSIEAAQRSNRHQAESLNLPLAEVDAPQHDSASQAVRELVNRYDGELSDDQRSEIAALDTLPEPLEGALTEYVDAFLAFDSSTREAYAEANLTRLGQFAPSQTGTAGPSVPGASPMTPQQFDKFLGDIHWDPLPWNHTEQPPSLPAVPTEMQNAEVRSLSEAHKAANLNLAEVFGARHSLLEAALSLHRALDQTDTAEVTASVDVPPSVAIDLQEEDSTYTEDYALTIDAGGNDTYQNNAGGSNLQQGFCKLSSAGTAAALLDLTGADQYTTEGSCGVTGGGYLGSGLLVDADGDDTYETRNRAAAHTPQTFQDQFRSSPGSATPSSTQMTDRYIVGYEEDPGLAVGDSFHNATVLEVVPTLDFLVVRAEDPVAFPAEAREDTNTRYVEPDGMVHVASTPNDPLFDQQYGPQQINAPAAWNTSTGDTTRSVCLVDTGIDYTHPEFPDSRWLGGIDTAEDDNDPKDTEGHGTHVAGIAAANIDNDTGIAGMAEVGIMAVKVFPDNRNYGYVSDVAEGVAWCAENGGDVISLSLGADHFHSLRQAIVDAWDGGSVIVASAGNSGCYDCIGYPAAYDEVMAVTCTDRHEKRCGYSSYGPEAEIAAPGDAILSTLAGCCSEAGYGNKSGTSMSAPHVTGVAALTWSQAANLTNGELRQLLRQEAQDPPGEGCTASLGYGVVDANATLEAAVSGQRPAYEGVSECFRLLGSFGANGGGSLGGTGLLVDASGDETYDAGSYGTNGGGHALGAGLLVDGDGDDNYTAESRAVNGGGKTGIGTLVDALGSDEYVGGFSAVNGGGSLTLGSNAERFYARGLGLLVDGDGVDRYSAIRSGINGGGAIGVGALVDGGGGDDTYLGQDGTGANGGAIIQAGGLLVDTGGQDRYDAGGGYGSNGGAFSGFDKAPPVGFLIDAHGADSYEGGSFGNQGGTLGVSAGFLFDGGSANDEFLTCGMGGNGGAVIGHAFLQDAGGNDRYVPAHDACYRLSDMNGGSQSDSGFLFDRSGDDLYIGDISSNGGTLGFWDTPGVDGTYGVLVDGSGDDTYRGANGGSTGDGQGFLIDLEGDDRYIGNERLPSNGAAQGNTLTEVAPNNDVSALGFLFDGGGDDRYEGQSVTNGGALLGAHGFLLDHRGDDTYEAERVAVNGGSGLSGVGFLRDGAGNDSYNATTYGANGGVWSPPAPIGIAQAFPISIREDVGTFEGPGSGLLLDESGTDTYADWDGSRGTDTSRVPKGDAGFQIDEPSALGLDPQLVPGPLWNLSEVVSAEESITHSRYDPPPSQPRETAIQWGAPLTPGAGPITEYRLYEVDEEGRQTLVEVFGDDSRSHREEGLGYLEKKHYRIAAENDVGEGDPTDVHVRAPRCESTGPDAGGYTCTEILFDWADTSDGTSLEFEDVSPSSVYEWDASGQIELPFNFTWYGEDRSYLRLTDFGLTCIGSCTDAELTAGPEHGVNCARTGPYQEPVPEPEDVRYNVTGESPNRAFVVEWREVPGGHTYQLQLTEKGKAQCMVEEAQPFSIGIQNANETSGLTYTSNFETISKIGVQFAQRPGHLLAVPTANATLAIPGEPVAFMDASSSPERVTDISWDFGDGTTSDKGAPVHTFEDPGTYNVTLTVGDAGGATDRGHLEVTVG